MQTKSSKIKKIMIRLTALFACLMFIGISVPVSADSLYDLPANTKISAKSAILVSLGPTREEDTSLYELQADSRQSPAALVRLMVGITAIEIIREKGLDIEKLTGKYTASVFNLFAGTGLATVQMAYGEEWTVRDLLSISMIQTAADACVTLAITLSGSQDQFVAKMNELAAKIGCKSTSFANVTGMDSPSQYTTARDLYKIVRYAMDYPEFEPLFSAIQYTVKPVSGGSQRTYATTNDMMRSTTSFYYSPMSFGKTGYTESAGRCLASVARDSGYEYLCIVMGEPNIDDQGRSGAYFRDTKTLCHWAFNNFVYQSLLDKGEPRTSIKVNLAWNKDSVSLVAEKGLSAVVINGIDRTNTHYKPTLFSQSVNAPVKKGQVLGRIELFIKTNQKIGEVNLVAAESVERSNLLAVWAQIESFLSSPWFYAGLVLLLLLLAGYVILNIVHNRNRRHRRMKRVRKFH